MNHYVVWIHDRREETEEEIEAATSFEARKIKAEQFQVSVFDCIAIRVDFVVEKRRGDNA